MPPAQGPLPPSGEPHGWLTRLASFHAAHGGKVLAACYVVLLAGLVAWPWRYARRVPLPALEALVSLGMPPQGQMWQRGFAWRTGSTNLKLAVPAGSAAAWEIPLDVPAAATGLRLAYRSEALAARVQAEGLEPPTLTFVRTGPAGRTSSQTLRGYGTSPGWTTSLMPLEPASKRDGAWTAQKLVLKVSPGRFAGTFELAPPLVIRTEQGLEFWRDGWLRWAMRPLVFPLLLVPLFLHMLLSWRRLRARYVLWLALPLLPLLPGWLVLTGRLEPEEPVGVVLILCHVGGCVVLNLLWQWLPLGGWHIWLAPPSGLTPDLHESGLQALNYLFPDGFLRRDGQIENLGPLADALGRISANLPAVALPLGAAVLLSLYICRSLARREGKWGLFRRLPGPVLAGLFLLTFVFVFYPAWHLPIAPASQRCLGWLLLCGCLLHGLFLWSLCPAETPGLWTPLARTVARRGLVLAALGAAYLVWHLGLTVRLPITWNTDEGTWRECAGKMVHQALYFPNLGWGRLLVWAAILCAGLLVWWRMRRVYPLPLGERVARDSAPGDPDASGLIPDSSRLHRDSSRPSPSRGEGERPACLAFHAPGAAVSPSWRLALLLLWIVALSVVLFVRRIPDWSSFMTFCYPGLATTPTAGFMALFGDSLEGGRAWATVSATASGLVFCVILLRAGLSWPATLVSAALYLFSFSVFYWGSFFYYTGHLLLVVMLVWLFYAEWVRGAQPRMLAWLGLALTAAFFVRQATLSLLAAVCVAVVFVMLSGKRHRTRGNLLAVAFLLCACLVPVYVYQKLVGSWFSYAGATIPSAAFVGKALTADRWALLPRTVYGANGLYLGLLFAAGLLCAAACLRRARLHLAFAAFFVAACLIEHLLDRWEFWDGFHRSMLILLVPICYFVAQFVQWVYARVGAWPAAALLLPLVVLTPYRLERIAPAMPCDLNQGTQPNGHDHGFFPEDLVLGAFPGRQPADFLSVGIFAEGAGRIPEMPRKVKIGAEEIARCMDEAGATHFVTMNSHEPGAWHNFWSRIRQPYCVTPEVWQDPEGYFGRAPQFRLAAKLRYYDYDVLVYERAR